MRKRLGFLLVFLIVLISLIPVYANDLVYLSLDGGKQEIITDHINKVSIESHNISDNSNDFNLRFELLDKNGDLLNSSSSLESLLRGERSVVTSYNKVLKSAYNLRVYSEKDSKVISNILDFPIKNREISGLIVDIPDLDYSITEDDEFNFPSKVKAKLSNGELVDVDVKWELDNENISLPGSYTFKGQVQGYSEKVILRLNVEEVDKIMKIDPVEINLDLGGRFELPREVLGLKTNGRYDFYEVDWDKFNIDSSIEGRHIVEGNVRGYGRVKAYITIEKWDLDTPIKFKNKDLEEAIMEELSVDFITRKSLLNLNKLNLIIWENPDIEELKYCRNLKDLSIQAYRFKINNIHALSELNKLESLNLFNIGINDISAIKNLTQLKTLNLGQNTISDITALKNLNKLEFLNLTGNIIDDIEVLGNKFELKELTLGNNPIKDYSPLLGIENLQIDRKILKETVTNKTLLKNLNLGEVYYLPKKVIYKEEAIEVQWDRKYLFEEREKVIVVNGNTKYGNIKCKAVYGDYFEDRIVNFRDKNLEKAIRKEIDKHKGNIYLSDVRNLKKLEGLGLGIKYLDGIENLKGLEKISFWANAIETSELYKLSELKNLKSLDLAENNLTYIPSGVFNKMSKLEELVLDGNKISNIDKEAFVGLDNLKDLLFEDNMVNDIQAVEVLTSLDTLFMRNNRVESIDSIKRLENLTSFWAGNNKITNIEVLDNLKKLSWVNLEDNNISSIESLKNLSELKRLNLSNNNIEDISVLEDKLKLEWLEISENKIVSIVAVRNLLQLTNLNLKNNKINDIEPLKNLVNLRLIYLGGNNIDDFSIIEHFAKDLKAKDFDY